MRRGSRRMSRGCTASSPTRGIVFNSLRLGLKRVREMMMAWGDGAGCPGWSRPCDHAAAVPAVRRLLGAFSSVHRVVDFPVACRSWYAQCTLYSRPWRSRACCCAATGALVGMCRKLWTSAVAVLGRRPVLGQGCCALWCNDWGLRNAWFNYGYMSCIIQGGFWKNFTIFYVAGCLGS